MRSRTQQTQQLRRLSFPFSSHFWVWGRRFFIRPSYIGLLYRRNQFERRLEPGVYYFWDFWSELEVIRMPRAERTLEVSGQEVLTKDNIALRFSYGVRYRIVDGEKLLTFIDPSDIDPPDYLFVTNNVGIDVPVERILHPLSQVYWREAISQIDSLALNEQRQNFFLNIPEGLNETLAQYGIEVTAMYLRDITFPKAIQDLFARQLEAKIRAQTDLENARSVVATARALKNAAQLIKEDDNIKFLQYLETLTKIASKGKHTFVIGELPMGTNLRPASPEQDS
ncbi:slipin family protein [Synechocystis sp. LKSZ1]|uniref:slipin family protein n=1 Tax=Synechocystis sp. LKSZ1 TaxID=3144951 RepID=UPI00336BE830